MSWVTSLSVHACLACYSPPHLMPDRLGQHRALAPCALARLALCSCTLCSHRHAYHSNVKTASCLIMQATGLGQPSSEGRRLTADVTVFSCPLRAALATSRRCRGRCGGAAWTAWCRAWRPWDSACTGAGRCRPRGSQVCRAVQHGIGDGLLNCPLQHIEIPPLKSAGPSGLHR